MARPSEDDESAGDDGEEPGSRDLERGRSPHGAEADRGRGDRARPLLVHRPRGPPEVVRDHAGDEEALNDGMGFDGSSITGFNAIEESDMVAIPIRRRSRSCHARSTSTASRSGRRSRA